VSKKGISGEIPQEVSFMPIQKIILLKSLHAAGMAFESLNNSEEGHSISTTLHVHLRKWINSR
jgi:pyridoxine/pyridoxamine 5'-phosphate oxidase